MERTELAERIRKVIASVVQHENFTMHDGLTANDVAGWDSLSHIKIIVGIETAFNIKFKLKDLNKMNVMGNVIELVNAKIEETRPA